MALSDDQVDVDGFVMGPGTGFHIVSVRGLEDQNLKVADSDLYGDGAYFGTDRLDVKDIAIVLNVEADTTEALQTQLDEFQEAWAPGDDKVLQWKRRGVLRQLTGRTREYGVDEALSHALSLTILAHFVANPETLGGS